LAKGKSDGREDPEGSIPFEKAICCYLGGIGGGLSSFIQDVLPTFIKFE